MKKHLTAALIVGIALCACSSHDKTGQTSAGAIDAKTVKIELPANPTTGYTWVIDNLAQLQNVKLVNSTFEQNNTGADKSMVGVGGKQVFVFASKDGKPGQEEVSFSYLRLWEKNVKPIEQKKFVITVK